jgi:hypothetical protein
VATLVEVHDESVRLAGDHPPCCHAWARQWLGRSGGKASPWLGPPALAPMGQAGHGGVESDGESYGTRHTIDVQAMHAPPPPVRDAMASRVADEQRPRPRLSVVGPEPGRGLPSQARDRSVAPCARVPWQVPRLLQGPEAWMPAGRRGAHRLAPWAGGAGPPAAQEGGPPPPERATPEAAWRQRCQLGRGPNLGITGQPRRMGAGAPLPTLHPLERCASLGTPGERRVGLADDLALRRGCANAPHPRPGWATPGQGGLGQPGGIAPTRERGPGQGAGVGVRQPPRRPGAEPACESRVLGVASGTRGVGGRVGLRGGHREARTHAQGRVAVQGVAGAAPCGVQELQDEPAQPGTGRGHQRGARSAGGAHQGRAVDTGQHGQAEQPPCHARAPATSRSQAHRTRSGDDGRLRDGWCWGGRLPLGAPQGGWPQQGGTAPACPWARNRQTIERPEVSRSPNGWALSCRRRPAMPKARSAADGR